MRLLTAAPILESVNWESFSQQNVKTLTILLVGHDPASELYVSIKERTAQKYNVAVTVHRLPETSTTEEVVSCVQMLSTADSCHALIVQLPLPSHIDTTAVVQAIAPEKDVDNLSGCDHFLSPMVRSVQAMQEFYMLDFTQGKVCVVGEGVVVGTPIIHYLEAQGISPVRINADTPDADKKINEAQILFGASGQTHRINATNTQQARIIFDCSGKDVDFESLKDTCHAITPSKGGIGPLTVHFLFMNVRQTG